MKMHLVKKLIYHLYKPGASEDKKWKNDVLYCDQQDRQRSVEAKGPLQC